MIELMSNLEGSHFCLMCVSSSYQFPILEYLAINIVCQTKVLQFRAGAPVRRAALLPHPHEIEAKTRVASRSSQLWE
jgi:hypothetical protein